MTGPFNHGEDSENHVFFEVSTKRASLHSSVLPYSSSPSLNSLSAPTPPTPPVVSRLGPPPGLSVATGLPLENAFPSCGSAPSISAGESETLTFVPRLAVHSGRFRRHTAATHVAGEDSFSASIVDAPSPSAPSVVSLSDEICLSSTAVSAPWVGEPPPLAKNVSPDASVSAVGAALRKAGLENDIVGGASKINPASLLDVVQQKATNDNQGYPSSAQVVVLSDSQKFAFALLVYMLVLHGHKNFEIIKYASVHDAAHSYKRWSAPIIDRLYKVLNISDEEKDRIAEMSRHIIHPRELAKSIANVDRYSNDAENLNGDMGVQYALLKELYKISTTAELYDARSRALLFLLADSWEIDARDVFAVESLCIPIYDAPEASETTMNARTRADRRRRIAAVAAATIGGGLLIGISAGIAAPYIGIGLAHVLSSMGIAGPTAFLTHAGGAAVITTGATLTGSGVAASKMAKRTKPVSKLQFIPITPERAMSMVITVGGWISKNDEDEMEIVSAFTIIDQLYGEHYSMLWEPSMLRELGNLLTMIAGEVVTTAVQQALMATMLGGLMAGLAWPLGLLKIGYLIDNPWQIALSRSSRAGAILAELLAVDRVQDARPVTLIAYSLGARLLLQCLIELGRLRAYGIVCDVVILGCPLSPSEEEWHIARSVVSGRFVNGYTLNDWVLGFLFRASVGGFRKVAGLAPSNIVGIEDVDLTALVPGHLNYRLRLPYVLNYLGIPLRDDMDLDFLIQKEESQNVEQKKSVDHQDNQGDSQDEDVFNIDALSSEDEKEVEKKVNLTRKGSLTSREALVQAAEEDEKELEENRQISDALLQIRAAVAQAKALPGGEMQ